MNEELLLGVGAIVVLGTSAQLVASRLRIPSILVLLLAGVVAGPLTGFVHPDEVFGEVLPTLVSLAVALILFDGGLDLRISELRDVRSVVRRLISVGVVVTWVVGAVAARYVLGLPLGLSVLLAAVLTVSGPTVVIPLLRHIRPTGRTASALKWEGIFVDPVGAVLAVLVFEVLVVGESRGAAGGTLVLGLARTALVGTLIGIAVAALLVWLLDRYLIADHLEVPATVGLVILAFVGSNLLSPESGLLAVTVMGVAVANQKRVPVNHIIEFNESIGVLLTSVLFVVLAARLTTDDLALIGWPVLAFIAVLVLVARPLAVLASTVATDLDRREFALLAWMAPRGIVAASVASIFALRLEEEGFVGAELLVPYTFAVIVGTVALYGLTAGPLARRLGLAQAGPVGLVVVGAHRWAREIAAVLCDVGVRTIVVPTNRTELRAARLAGLDVFSGSVLKEDVFDELSLDGVGGMVALTHNEEFNALAAVRFTEVFGRSAVYQLSPDREPGQDNEVTRELRGRVLFGPQATFTRLDERFAEGAQLKRTKITAEFDRAAFAERYGPGAMVLFVLEDDGSLQVVTDEAPADPVPGQTLIALVDPVDGDEKVAVGAASADVEVTRE